jgi:predicted DNA-binding protein (MmcQ/YjbR family)
MLTHKQLEEYILKKPHSRLDYPFGKETAVYKVGEGESAKIFALIAEKSKPLRISLKCDPTLAEVLRERYESVLPGYHLNKRHWNTVILTGQLADQEVLDLVNLSYQLVVG